MLLRMLLLLKNAANEWLLTELPGSETDLRKVTIIWLVYSSDKCPKGLPAELLLVFPMQLRLLLNDPGRSAIQSAKQIELHTLVDNKQTGKAKRCCCRFLLWQ